MYHFRKALITLAVIITLTLGFVGTASADQEPRGGMFDPWFNVKTSIAYSSGSDKEWAYGNQQKEFSTTKPCYVRIGSAVQAVWHWFWWWGEGHEVTITYRLIGAESCSIEKSDGFLDPVETSDPNVLVFTKTIKAKKEIEEEPVVFKYTPKGVGSVCIEVKYDDSVHSAEDVRNTVYFVDDSDYE